MGLTKCHVSANVMTTSQTAAPMSQRQTITLSRWSFANSRTTPTPIAVPIPDTTQTNQRLGIRSQSCRRTTADQRGRYDGSYDELVADEFVQPPCVEELHLHCDDALWRWVRQRLMGLVVKAYSHRFLCTVSGVNIIVKNETVRDTCLKYWSRYRQLSSTPLSLSRHTPVPNSQRLLIACE